MKTSGGRFGLARPRRKWFGVSASWSDRCVLKPQSHISTDQHGSPGKCQIPPDQDPGIIRADFGVVERRRSSNERHPGGKTAATRTNPAKHGSNTPPTRMTTDGPEQSRQSDEPTRTNAAETRTASNEHGPTRRVHGPSRTYTAVIRTNTDRPGQSKTCIKAV